MLGSMPPLKCTGDSSSSVKNTVGTGAGMELAPMKLTETGNLPVMVWVRQEPN